MTVEIKQCDRELAIAICRLTGWRGVADRLEQGWQPMPDTSESEILALIAAFRIQSEPSGDVAKMREALEWYAEQVAGCRKLGLIGDPFRNTLDADGGKRAIEALSTLPQEQRQEAAIGVEIAEMFQMAHDLIQEAKGGSQGTSCESYVTSHLDDAENWLYRIEERLSTPKAAGETKHD